MNVFFEQSEKRGKDLDSSSSELMEMINNRSDVMSMSDINRSFLIESVTDLPKNNNENENDESSDSNKIYEIKETTNHEKIVLDWVVENGKKKEKNDNEE